MKRFGDQIAAWRDKLGLTQLAFAKRCIDPETKKPLSRSALMEIENDYKTRARANPQTLRKLAAGLGVDVPTLIRAIETDADFPDEIPFGRAGAAPSEKSAAPTGAAKPVAGAASIPSRPRPIPLYGYVPATMGEALRKLGRDAPAASENDRDGVSDHLPGELFPHDPAAGATWVNGKSMEPEFKHGDIVVYAPSLAPQIQTGDVCCVQFSQLAGGGCTMKYVRMLDDGRIELIAGRDGNNSVADSRVVPLEYIDQCYPVVLHIRNVFAQRKTKWNFRVPPAEDKIRDKCPQGMDVQTDGVEQPFPDYDTPQ